MERGTGRAKEESREGGMQRGRQRVEKKGLETVRGRIGRKVAGVFMKRTRARVSLRMRIHDERERDDYDEDYDTHKKKNNLITRMQTRQRQRQGMTELKSRAKISMAGSDLTQMHCVDEFYREWMVQEPREAVRDEDVFRLSLAH